MIYISVQSNKDRVVGMNIHGHAHYANPGEDLVCAGVSSIATGLCNALDILHPSTSCTIANNIITIKISEPNDVSQTIMQTGIIQLETMVEVYSKYIKIIKQEV
ncbi:MAG: ribosomal-processing cysteine protease Prp [Erysipelotrichaceae bacterium]|nr:ribosomal-processing cysteine protease Prp [Erysipelotrichaceae bacterium]